MQGPRSTGDSSTGINYTDGEPICSTNSEATSNSMLNPVDLQFPNNSTGSGRPTYASSSSHVVQNHNWWSFGESSSRLGPSDQVNSIGSKTDRQLPSDGYGFEEGQSGSNGMMLSGGVQIGSHTRTGPSFLRGSSSNHMLGHVNLGKDMEINGSGLQSSGVVIRHNNCESSLGSSSQTAEERSNGLGGLGSSCKRKALEGAPSHSFPSESHGCFFQTENSAWNEGLAQYDASSSLSLSMSSPNPPNVTNQSGLPEPRFGTGGGRAVATSAFPSVRSSETLSRPGRRLNPGQLQESVAFSFSQPGSSVLQQQHLPATSAFVDPMDARAIPITGSSSSGEGQPSMIHLPALTRNIHQFAWNASSSSRTNNMPEEGFGPPWDAPRINSEQPVFTTPSTETRNPVQDQFHWSFTRGSSSSSGDSPFVPRAGSSSGIHGLQPNPSWVAPHNQSRISEVAPWSLFPSTESESAAHGASLPLLPTGPSVSSNEAAVPSGSSSRSHRSRQRRSGLLLERQSDLLHLRHLGRSLASDNDGRNRLISEIRQVLSAMRRGENLRFEDYMVFDPLIYHGMAEMHDRHRDMRLDVDNMSYEELLALGERIGDVSTGLSEEVILKAMKQHKHTSSAAESHQDMEPCCVCQEEYEEGDDLGTLGCGHEFHTACVKQWLMLKNLCPICKTVALST
ncbi:E3 ubiquitin-protein ligase MBR2 [Cardamine amara subsp. amara]|uniref:RING-type E3 ubiquitin transferase n=1 Tax=Cardamine amara subsp. amara TaxID=228776 RepID=A0ABD1BA44_CARAN